MQVGTLRATPFRVLPGLGETGPRPGNSTDLSLVMRLERLARATSIPPSLHALEGILRPTQAEPLISKYGSNIFR
jgi:hypothetical protein